MTVFWGLPGCDSQAEGRLKGGNGLRKGIRQLVRGCGQRRSFQSCLKRLFSFFEESDFSCFDRKRRNLFLYSSS